MKDPRYVEELVRNYGEMYRRLIESFLEFHDRESPKWELDEPLDIEAVIADLVERAK